MGEGLNILIILAKAVPVIAALLFGIRYFYRKEKYYISTISNLQKELRDNEKDTLTLMGKLTNTLDRILNDNKEDKQDILREIRELKDSINKKL